jgi:hypothetical protein
MGKPEWPPLLVLSATTAISGTEMPRTLSRPPVNLIDLPSAERVTRAAVIVQLGFFSFPQSVVTGQPV